jgi:hypothetical protein
LALAFTPPQTGQSLADLTARKAARRVELRQCHRAIGSSRHTEWCLAAIACTCDS